MIRVVNENPPLIEEIDRKFRVKGKPILYAWQDRIYNPQGVRIPPQLMAHEVAHMARQANVNIEDWWRKYIEDDRFRLQEEIPAHFAEYLWLATKAPNRQMRRGALKETARRLASPLYGRLISPKEAATILKKVVDDNLNRRHRSGRAAARPDDDLADQHH